MEELIETIVAKTGLTRAQAERVALITVQFVTDHLPAGEAAEVNAALERAKVAGGTLR